MSERTLQAGTLRLVLLAALFACVMHGLVGVAQPLLAGWEGTYLVLIAALLPLLAQGARILRRRAVYERETLTLRALELVLLIILLKLGRALTSTGLASLLDELRNPERFFLNPIDIGALLIIVLLRQAAGETLEEIAALNEPLVIRDDQATTPQGTGELYASLALDQLTTRFVFGGGLLLLAAGLSVVNVRALVDVERAPAQGVIITVLIYFMLGMVMLTQLRYVALQRHWAAERLALPAALNRRWALASVGLLALAASGALLLPTGYAALVLATIVALALLISLVAWSGVALVVMLALLPILLLSTLLTGSEPIPPEAGPVVLEPAPVSSGGADWLALLRTGLLWAALLALVIYLLRSYLRDNPGLLQRPAPARIIGWLRRMWARLTGWLRRAPSAIPVAELVERARAARPSLPSVAALRRPQSARERIIATYLALLRSAAHAGHQRRPGQTPGELRAELGEALPEHQREVEALTDSFVAARYSRHEPEQGADQRARQSWQRLRAALRRLRTRGRP